MGEALVAVMEVERRRVSFTWVSFTTHKHTHSMHVRERGGKREGEKDRGEKEGLTSEEGGEGGAGVKVAGVGRRARQVQGREN